MFAGYFSVSNSILPEQAILTSQIVNTFDDWNSMVSWKK